MLLSKFARPSFLSIILWLAIGSTSYAQSFSQWSISAGDLTNGHLELYAGDIKSIVFTVKFQQSGTTTPSSASVRLTRVPNRGNLVPLMDDNHLFTVSSSNYTGGVATVSFTANLIVVGRGNTQLPTYLRNGDEIMLEYRIGGSWFNASKTYNVQVALDPIDGNTVCCNYCLTKDSPADLKQAPGTAITGGDREYQFQWEGSSDGEIFSKIVDETEGFNLATNPNYKPKNITQTSWYRRTVKSTSTSSTGFVNPVISNVVKVEIINVQSAPTIPARTYAQNEVIKGSGQITVTGDQIPDTGVNVEFLSDTRIQIVAPTRLAPNARFSAVSSFCSIGSNGREAAVFNPGMTAYTQASDESTDPTSDYSTNDPISTGRESDEVMIYPNPSKGTTTIRYYVKEQGNFSMSISSSRGGSNVSLMNEINVMPGLYTYQLDTRPYSQGVYLISLINNAKKETKRLSIVNE